MGAVADNLVKDEFRNKSVGYIGVTIIDPDGRRRGIAVPPEESVFLSEDEQILTANAPRREEDNPFANGTLVLETEAAELKNRRVIGNTRGPRAPLAASPQALMGASAEGEETGAVPAPSEEPPQGETAPSEEVATPEALTARAPSPSPQGQEAEMVPPPAPLDTAAAPKRRGRPPASGRINAG